MFVLRILTRYSKTDIQQLRLLRNILQSIVRFQTAVYSPDQVYDDIYIYLSSLHLSFKKCYPVQNSLAYMVRGSP